jgi:hypothetical protein
MKWTLAKNAGSETTLRACAVARDGLRSPWRSLTVGFE